MASSVIRTAYAVYAPELVLSCLLSARLFCGYTILEPFTDLTFPKENILPEEKKNSWIHGKNFEYERLSISACEHARVL